MVFLLKQKLITWFLLKLKFFKSFSLIFLYLIFSKSLRVSFKIFEIILAPHLGLNLILFTPFDLCCNEHSRINNID